jgi:hypothetical protein
MMSTCLSAVCVLGIVIIGILIMTRIISLGQIVNAIGRAFLLLVAVLVALCMLKGLLMTAATALFFVLKRLVVWLAIIALVIIFALLVARIAISKFEKWLPGRGNHHRSEP